MARAAPNLSPDCLLCGPPHATSSVYGVHVAVSEQVCGLLGMQRTRPLAALSAALLAGEDMSALVRTTTDVKSYYEQLAASAVRLFVCLLFLLPHDMTEQKLYFKDESAASDCPVLVRGTCAARA